MKTFKFQIELKGSDFSITVQATNESNARMEMWRVLQKNTHVKSIEVNGQKVSLKNRLKSLFCL